MSRSLESLASYLGVGLGLSREALTQAYRPAVESEIPQILELRSAVNRDMWWDDHAFVTWRYFSRRMESGEVPYWVFVKDGELLGACGLEPITLVVDGVELSAVRALDIMVRPDLHGVGLGAFMNLMLFSHFPVMLVTGSNDRSHHLLTRMFHHATDLRFWKTPLRARAVLDAKISVGPLSTLIAGPADLILCARRSISRVRVPADVSIREMAQFDSRVEELSRRCEGPRRLMARRSSEYLNWRFVLNPRCQYRIFGAFVGKGLEGYLVTRLNVARPNPRREAEIVDWLASPSHGSEGGVLSALVQTGVDVLRHDGAGMVTCAAAAADIAGVMDSTGFRFRPAERLPFFVKAADPNVHARLSAGEEWFLTQGDYDVE